MRDAGGDDLRHVEGLVAVVPRGEGLLTRVTVLSPTNWTDHRSLRLRLLVFLRDRALILVGRELSTPTYLD